MSFFKIILLAVIAIVIFQFIGNSNNEDNGNYFVPLNTKILAFGDSITYGYRVDKDKNYPSILSKLLQTKVINAGVSGENARRGLERLPALLKKYKPQILIICEGGNDILRNDNLLKTKADIAKMIELAQKKHIFIVLVGVPKLDILTLKTAKFYYELSDEFNVPLEDEGLQEIMNDDSLKIDSVHPNAAGYKILASKIAAIITNDYTTSDFQ